MLGIQSRAKDKTLSNFADQHQVCASLPRTQPAREDGSSLAFEPEECIKKEKESQSGSGMTQGAARLRLSEEFFGWLIFIIRKTLCLSH